MTNPDALSRRLNACYQRVYEIVREIPRGRVMTYGQIAEMVEELCTNAVPAIQVGRAMANADRYAPDIPWWRVIGKEGDAGVIRHRSHGGLQRLLLEREGIRPDAAGQYDLSRYQYFPEGWGPVGE